MVVIQINMTIFTLTSPPVPRRLKARMLVASWKHVCKLSNYLSIIAHSSFPHIFSHTHTLCHHLHVAIDVQRDCCCRICMSLTLTNDFEILSANMFDTSRHSKSIHVQLSWCNLASVATPFKLFSHNVPKGKQPPRGCDLCAVSLESTTW